MFRKATVESETSVKHYVNFKRSDKKVIKFVALSYVHAHWGGDGIIRFGRVKGMSFGLDGSFSRFPLEEGFAVICWFRESGETIFFAQSKAPAYFRLFD